MIRPLLFLLGVTSSTLASAQDTAPRNASVPMDGASRIEIKARAGYLKVNGQPGVSTVTVNGTARASSSRRLEEIKLIAERRGDAVYIEAVVGEPGRISISFGESWAALDLDIVVPAGVPITATDGSGEAEFRGTGALNVTDGSGSLHIEDVMGEVVVNDSSGEIVIRNATGPVSVRDGSGSMLIESVGRELTIVDGSGEIRVRRAGHVTVESDGSGNIDITDAAGSVRIGSAGSGTVSVSDVGGDLTVSGTRASRIRHANVRGQVSLSR